MPESLDEQKRIANVFENIDEKIKNIEFKINEHLLLERGLIHKFIENIEHIPIKEFVDSESGNSFPESLQKEKTFDYKFIRVSDMNLKENFREIKDSNNFVSKKVVELKKYRTFSKGTIVFPKVGATILTNKRRIINDNNTICDNNIMGFKPKENCDYLFLYYFLKSIDMSKFTQVGAVPSLNNSLLDKLMFPDLSKEKQVEYSCILYKNDLVVDNLKKEKEKLEQIKKGLLNKLL